MITGQVPSEHVMQVQAALLISGRKWIDYVSYCGGMPIMPIRVYPNPEIHEAIITAATAFEKAVLEKMDQYYKVEKSLDEANILIKTERRKEGEITL
jgi:hypothetical protein